MLGLDMSGAVMAVSIFLILGLVLMIVLAKTEWGWYVKFMLAGLYIGAAGITASYYAFKMTPEGAALGYSSQLTSALGL